MRNYILTLLIHLMGVLGVQAQDKNAIDWYKDLMANLILNNQTIKANVIMYYDEDYHPEQHEQYEFAMLKKEFFARIGEKEMLLTKDLFVNINHNLKVVLIEHNENEESREKRMNDFLEVWSKSINHVLESKTGNIKLNKKEKDYVLEINYDGYESSYSKMVMKFNPENKRVLYIDYWFHEYSFAGTNLEHHPTKMKLQYNYLSFKENNLLTDINKVVSISKNGVKLTPKYEGYELLNLSGYAFEK